MKQVVEHTSQGDKGNDPLRKIITSAEILYWLVCLRVFKDQGSGL